MHKFSALFKNEVIKAVRKPLYIILLAIIVASMLLVGGFIGIGRAMSETVYLSLDGNQDLDSLNVKLQDTLKDVDSAASKAEKELAKYYDEEMGGFKDLSSYDDFYYNYYSSFDDRMYEVNYLLQRISEKYVASRAGNEALNDSNTAGYALFRYIRNDVESSYYSGEMKKISEQLSEKYPLLAKYDDTYGYSSLRYDSSLILPEEKYNEYLKIIVDNDIAKVFDNMRDDIRYSSFLGETEKKNQLESIDVMQSLYRDDMSYDSWTDIQSAFTRLSNYKSILESGTDASGVKLTEDQKAEYALMIAEIETGMKVGAPGYGGKYSTTDKTTGTTLIDIGLIFSQILVVLFGALIVAEDFQSGAIKTLIIAPVKRRRIVDAKFALMAVLCLTCALLVFISYMIAAFISGSDFGTNIFVVGNNVITMSGFFYYLFYVLVSFIPIFFHGCFAFMLSTLFRNAGGSISVSMATIFVVNTYAATFMSVMTMIMGGNTYFLQHLQMFLPSSNTAIADALFASSLPGEFNLGALLTGQLLGNTELNNPLFSFFYLAILSAVFIFISYQSYIKRDIK